MTLFELKNLHVRIDTPRGGLQAVRGLSYALKAGECLGLVGESGSGKSVHALAALGLLPRNAQRSADKLNFQGRDLLRLSARELRDLRGNQISFIFQDPLSALHPLLTIERQLTEVLERHRNFSRTEVRRKAAAALGDLGLSDPEARLKAYPHQLSGGMRQRVVIAMALLCEPKLLFADEPTTALDVTVQAQVLELLHNLREKLGTAMVLITHDLAVVAAEADRVAVMYAGQLVECARTQTIIEDARHPYTRGLLSCVPKISGAYGQALAPIPGAPPDPLQLPPGCSFSDRCTIAIPKCRSEEPSLLAQLDGRLLACPESGRLQPQGWNAQPTEEAAP